MKKRVLLICGVAILLLLLGCMTFFLITKGRNYSADGLELNDRVYISSIYIENETVHYTLVNQSCRRLSVSSQPVVASGFDTELRMFSKSSESTATDNFRSNSLTTASLPFFEIV